MPQTSSKHDKLLLSVLALADIEHIVPLLTDNPHSYRMYKKRVTTWISALQPMATALMTTLYSQSYRHLHIKFVPNGVLLLMELPKFNHHGQKCTLKLSYLQSLMTTTLTWVDNANYTQEWIYELPDSVALNTIAINRTIRLALIESQHPKRLKIVKPA